MSVGYYNPFDALNRLELEFKHQCQRLLGDDGQVLRVQIQDLNKYSAVVDTHYAALLLYFHWMRANSDHIICFVEEVKGGWCVTRWPKEAFGGH